MQTISSLFQAPPLAKPIALAIGVFDGVHLGHQALLKRLSALGTPVVLTFSNHPLTILKPDMPLMELIPLQEKLHRLERCGVQLTILLPFTHALSEMPYDAFLKMVHQFLPFSALVFGEGDALGKGRAGTPDKVRALGKDMGFTAEYLPKVLYEGEIVSSGRIRKMLALGQDPSPYFFIESDKEQG